jgi:hypothetical protein
MSANFKKYISIFLVLCLVVALASLVSCKNKKEPEETTPAVTTPNTTTPEETTPSDPSETTPSYPAEGETDPKQEDVFDD